MQYDINRVVCFPEVTTNTGYARPSIYKKITRGDFPAPFKLGDRAIGWRLSGIERFIRERENSISLTRGLTLGGKEFAYGA